MELAQRPVRAPGRAGRGGRPAGDAGRARFKRQLAAHDRRQHGPRHSQAAGAEGGRVGRALLDAAAAARARSTPVPMVRDVPLASCRQAETPPITRLSMTWWRFRSPTRSASRLARAGTATTSALGSRWTASRRGRTAGSQSPATSAPTGTRNRIERVFTRIKRSRRVATRYEKSAVSSSQLPDPGSRGSGCGFSPTGPDLVSAQPHEPGREMPLLLAARCRWREGLVLADLGSVRASNRPTCRNVDLCLGPQHALLLRQ